MDQREQKIVLEKFLAAHGIEMRPTARLCHYGRRFSAFFPDLASDVNPDGKKWGRVIIADLAEHVRGLDPADHQKSPDAKPIHIPKKYRDMPGRGGVAKANKTRSFLQSWDWRGLRFEVLRERGAKCELCGATAADQRIEVDHIKPLSKHWHMRLDKSNLQVLCRDCNQGKGNRSEDDFRVIAA
jgi:hypothetical protein